MWDWYGRPGNWRDRRTTRASLWVILMGALLLGMVTVVVAIWLSSRIIRPVGS